MKDPMNTNKEFVGGIPESTRGIAGTGDTFKWENAYRELAQSQAGQKSKVKLPRESEDNCRDESGKSFESTANPILNAAGQIERFSGIDREIAERKRMEAALKAAHDELEMHVADRTHELMRVNEGLRTEIAERKRMEAVLQAAHDELERRSAVRTDELLLANEGLQTEIAERFRTEEALKATQADLEALAAVRTDELMRVNEGLRTEIAERKRMEAVLQAAHDELEARSVVRTDELLRVNDGLQNEISERIRTEEALKAAHAELEARTGARMEEFLGVNDKLRTDIAERQKAEEQLQNTLDRFQTMLGTTIQVMGSAVEIKDPHAAGHQIRSAALARNIARMMGLSHDQINTIRMAGSIHDIGKLSVPAEILSKPGRLSEIEFPLVKEHAKKGYEILKDIEFPWPLAEIVHQHHERMDGSGYPRHLRGDEICIEARIMAVADVVEAMVSHRPYRPALGIEAALAEIEMNSGTLYDTTVVGACLQLFRERGFQFAEV